MLPRRLLAIFVLSLMLVSVAAFGETGQSTLVEMLNASTAKLVAQNEVLKAATSKYQSAVNEKEAAEAKLAAAKKTLAATTDAKQRSVLEAQIAGLDRTVQRLAVAMIEYQKMIAKEAREDRAMARKVAELELSLKRLVTDNKKLDLGMKEAGEKAAIAMRAADTQLGSGIVSQALSIADTPPPPAAK